MDSVLTLTDTPDPVAKRAAGAALYDHNVAQTGIANRRPIAVLASDPATREVLGGLWGRTELGVLFLDILFLPERVRGHGLGSRMLAQIEAEARRRGCRHAVVETRSFQAPGFYARYGLEEFGRIAFAVPGQARVFFRKQLDEADQRGNQRALAAPRLVPEFDVADLDRSLAFYIGVLGFVALYDRPEDRFAYLDRGGAHLMLEEAGRRFQTAPLEHPHGRGVNLQIEATDVDALYGRVQQAGSAPLIPLEECWYRRGDAELGNRQFVVADPDGYLLRFLSDLGQRAARQ